MGHSNSNPCPNSFSHTCISIKFLLKISLLNETWWLQEYREWSAFIQPEYIPVSAQRSFAKTPHPSSPTGWQPIPGLPQAVPYVTRTQSYTWVKRDKVEQVSCLRKQPEDKSSNHKYICTEYRSKVQSIDWTGKICTKEKIREFWAFETCKI